MIGNKEEIAQQLSELIHKDIVTIISDYSKKSSLSLELILILVKDVNLIKIYDVKYAHNNELNEVISLIKNEIQNDSTARSIALQTVFTFLTSLNRDFKQDLYKNLVLNVHHTNFSETFSFFLELVSDVKELFSNFIEYVFNDSFLNLNETIQIECIYKCWMNSITLFHDNEASIYAYNELKKLFDKALMQEKTEVAFWLYYTPLHYYNTGTNNDINKVNEKFKKEIEKPLENYILNKLVPKYKIKKNNKKINKNGKIKVAFVMQRLIPHSTLNVFYSLIELLMKEKNDKYTFILYDLSFSEAGGSDRRYVEMFKKLGIEYKNLHLEIFYNMFPTYSLLEKCLKSRNILINDQIDILIGLHTRIEYIFLYATRTAAKQIYWYHSSNAVYDIEGIDKRISHGDVFLNNFKFDIFRLPIDSNKYNPLIDFNEVNTLMKLYPNDYIKLGTIGRLIKIDNWEYLRAVAKIMNDNPNTIYIACGSGDKEKILQKIKSLGLENRFYFPGYINPHIYGYIIDIWLDTFPLGQGESKAEFYNKERNVFIMLMQCETKEERRERVKKFLEENRAYFEEACEFYGITFEKYNYLAFDVTELTQAFDSTEEYVFKANALIKSYDNQELIADLKMLKKVYNYASNLISNQSFEKVL